jgi:hypothetical protein
VKANLNIYPVKWMDDVLELALERLPEPRLVEDADGAKKQLPDVGSQDDEVSINPH